MNTTTWIPISHKLPPERTKVMTKIDNDNDSARNEQILVRQGNLWFFPDMSMYVYYRPTHWRELDYGE